MNFIEPLKYFRNFISRVQHIFYISPECPFHTLGAGGPYHNIHHYFYFCRTTKVNRSTKSVISTHLKKS